MNAKALAVTILLSLFSMPVNAQDEYPEYDGVYIFDFEADRWVQMRPQRMLKTGIIQSPRDDRDFVSLFPAAPTVSGRVSIVHGVTEATLRDVPNIGGSQIRIFVRSPGAKLEFLRFVVPVERMLGSINRAPQPQNIISNSGPDAAAQLKHFAGERAPDHVLGGRGWNPAENMRIRTLDEISTLYEIERPLDVITRGYSRENCRIDCQVPVTGFALVVKGPHTRGTGGYDLPGDFYFFTRDGGASDTSSGTDRRSNAQVSGRREASKDLFASREAIGELASMLDAGNCTTGCTLSDSTVVRLVENSDRIGGVYELSHRLHCGSAGCGTTAVLVEDENVILVYNGRKGVSDGMARKVLGNPDTRASLQKISLPERRKEPGATDRLEVRSDETGLCRTVKTGTLATQELLSVFADSAMNGLNVKKEPWSETLTGNTLDGGQTRFTNKDGQAFDGRWRIRDGEVCFSYGERTNWSCKSIARCVSGEGDFVIIDKDDVVTSLIVSLAPRANEQGRASSGAASGASASHEILASRLEPDLWSSLTSTAESICPGQDQVCRDAVISGAGEFIATILFEDMGGEVDKRLLRMLFSNPGQMDGNLERITQFSKMLEDQAFTADLTARIEAGLLGELATEAVASMAFGILTGVASEMLAKHYDSIGATEAAAFTRRWMEAFVESASLAASSHTATLGSASVGAGLVWAKNAYSFVNLGKDQFEARQAGATRDQQLEEIAEKIDSLTRSLITRRVTGEMFEEGDQGMVVTDRMAAAFQTTLSDLYNLQVFWLSSDSALLLDNLDSLLSVAEQTYALLFFQGATSPSGLEHANSTDALPGDLGSQRSTGTQGDFGLSGPGTNLLDQP